ncbi:MAG: hypothetical protein K0R90_757 [Oscillospiraceae bacterium]|nr:hypothetical protein [Oscillospiraceae bacterium]
MQHPVIHTFEPVHDENTKILILGTMPSPKSRENGFYYSHPQNRFWRILAQILSQDTPRTIQEKQNFLLNNHIALWDVLKSCDIKGADDNSIKNPVANDISVILSAAPINAIFTTGKKATELYKKHCFFKTNIPSIYLPSTSPANCGHYRYEDLVREYQILLEYLK